MFPPSRLLKAPRFCIRRSHSRQLNLKPRSLFSSKRLEGPPYSHIVQIGDPVLRLRCDPVDPKDIKSMEIQNVIASMKFALKRFDGVGISAPQIGVPLQISMIQFTPSQLEFWSPDHQATRQMEAIPLKILINPKLHILDKSQVAFEEGCTSMYGYSALVPRYKKVKVTSLDGGGEAVQWTAGGWSARIAQHELDHLQGKMFVDRADLDTLSFDYWNIINLRAGDFRLGYDGIKPGPTRFMSKFFRKK